MEYVNFYLTVLLLLPIIIIVLDFLIKTLYIVYWDGVFNKRFVLLIESIKDKTLRVRRIDGYGNYMIYVKKYNSRYIEFIGDGNGYIILNGVKEKVVRMLDGDVFNATYSIKLNNINGLKQEYIDLISKDNYMIGPEKFVSKGNSFRLKKNNDPNNDIRVLSIKTFNKRKKTTPDLYKLVNFSEYIKECVDCGIRTEKEMDDLITDLIMNKVY